MFYKHEVLFEVESKGVGAKISRTKIKVNNLCALKVSIHL